MKISDLFGSKKCVLSFEVFPPKKESGVNTIYDTLENLKNLKPDFISVTYGAGGYANGVNLTSEIAARIKRVYNIEPLAHLTCINSGKSDVLNVLSELSSQGISNVLALRGDRVEGAAASDFTYASELIPVIKNAGDFDIAGACYPEGHIESSGLDEDIIHLKNKVDSGLSHLITQLFFDNSLFYSFMEKIQKAGIRAPVQAGIMPVINKKQIERIVSLCGVSLPVKFTKIMNRYEGNPEALRDAGIAYAVEQCVDLITSGTRGLHIYTMNNPYVAQKITESIGSLIRCVNENPEQ
ncbi:MAG: methylenetetrahydrofolate reductase [NAD(P)H] [Bacillota bacterium]|nr:methylenetetrahydrofolate reductase [NAD(P)H] [Bacillota bacterium]